MALIDLKGFKMLAKNVSEKMKRVCPAVGPCKTETLPAVP